MAGRATLGLVVLNAIRRHIEQIMGSKPGNRFSLQVPALHTFDDELIGSTCEINPFFSKFLWAMVFHHSNKNVKAEQVTKVTCCM